VRARGARVCVCGWLPAFPAALAPHVQRPTPSPRFKRSCSAQSATRTTSGFLNTTLLGAEDEEGAGEQLGGCRGGGGSRGRGGTPTPLLQ
jgi:hypothetical protein